MPQSSFTRRAPTGVRPAPVGTLPSPSTPTLHLLPTGLPSLDDLLGGGLPLGSTLLVLAPDSHSVWGRLVERYWISQGLLTGQRGVVVGDLSEVKDTVRGCMWTAKGDGGERGEGESDAEGGVGERGEGRGGGRIAWRYERMKTFQTTVSGTGPQLSLMTTIPGEIVKHVESTGQLAYIDLNADSKALEVGPSRQGSLTSAIEKLSRTSDRLEEGMATRVTVHELGSLDWGEITSHGIHRFLHSLRSIIRNKSASALVTLPSHLARSPPPGCGLSKEAWIKSLAWAVDGCIELRGFGDDPTLPVLFPHSHGLLTLHSFPTSHHLLPPTLKSSFLLGAGENNLGFKLKRKHFVIETVHLGVEGGVGERRTEPAPEVGMMLASVPKEEHGEESEDKRVEGVEKLSEGVNMPKGPKDVEKKVRGKVRFGDSHEQSDAGGHTHGSGAGRPVVRHDRMDLYEF